MKLRDVERVLGEIDESQGKAVSTTAELRKLFTDTKEPTFMRTVSNAVDKGILHRAQKGLFVHVNTKVRRYFVATQLVHAYRPNSINYVSLETALSMWGVISQVTFSTTIMTTGRSGVLKSNGYGNFYFTHTDRDIAQDVKDKKSSSTIGTTVLTWLSPILLSEI